MLRCIVRICKCFCESTLYNAWWIFVFLFLLQIFSFSHFLNRSKITYRGWQHDSTKHYTLECANWNLKEGERYTQNWRERKNDDRKYSVWVLYFPDTIIMLYAVDSNSSSSSRVLCLRSGYCYLATQFYYQKRALFFYCFISFHFVSFQLMELRSVKTIFPLSFCFSLYLKVPLFTFALTSTFILSFFILIPLYTT